MSELLKLAERLERATADEQAGLLAEAFRAVHGQKPPRVHGGSKELDDWLAHYNPFYRMLEAKAYESAAMTLVPEGWDVNLRIHRTDSEPSTLCCLSDRAWLDELPSGVLISVDAATPALALCAAALRALASSTPSRTSAAIDAIAADSRKITDARVGLLRDAVERRVEQRRTPSREERS